MVTLPVLDFLSVSPSLVDILSLLPVNDLSTCRLVSRSLLQTIIRNHHAMNRHKIFITLSKVEIDPGNECVRIDLPRDSWSNRSRVAIRVNSKEVNVIFGLNHTFMNVFKGAIDKVTVKSITEGLRLVLDPLFYYCHVNTLILFDDASQEPVPSEWYLTVARSFKENRTKCNVLRSRGVPELETLIRQLVNRSNVHVEANLSSHVSGRLSVIASELHFCTFYTEALDRDLIVVLTSLIKGWYASQRRVLGMQIYWREAFENVTTVIFGILNSLDDNGCEWHWKWRSEEDEEMECFVRRRGDGEVLCLQFTPPHERYLSLHDAPKGTDLKDMEFDVDVLTGTYDLVRDHL